MTKIDIISGFLGAGKTTFIKKLIAEAMNGEKVVLIENEFGEIGIDGGFLKDAGIEIREMNSGCICCSLVGDFGTSLKEVITKYQPERIIIEPSGVGKLSDVIKAVEDVIDECEVKLNSAVTVVDGSKCKMYMKNFGEFFNNQVENANTIIVSRTDKLDDSKINEVTKQLRSLNDKANIVTTPIDKLGGAKLLVLMEEGSHLEEELLKAVKEKHHHHHEDGEECCSGHHHEHEHHHHHEDGEECCCGHNHEHEHHHHHEDGEECCCGHHHEHEQHHHHEDGEECCSGHNHEHKHHHYHEDGEECCCGHNHEHEHHHHHDDGEECCCGHHHEHAHHHADEVFTSWGKETSNSYFKTEIEQILEKLANTEEAGVVLRSKGMVKDKESEEWLYFDLVPGEYEVRSGAPEYTGKICVIGSKLNEEVLAQLFNV